VDVQYFSTACPSRASEIQALMVLRGSDTILAKNLPIIRNNLERLDAFMARYPDLFSWVRPRAGAIAFLKFKGPLYGARFFERIVQSKMPLVSTPVRLKLLHAYDQWDSSRVFITLTG
jgi:hypothetical protein